MTIFSSLHPLPVISVINVMCTSRLLAVQERHSITRKGQQLVISPIVKSLCSPQPSITLRDHRSPCFSQSEFWFKSCHNISLVKYQNYKLEDIQMQEGNFIYTSKDSTEIMSLFQGSQQQQHTSHGCTGHQQQQFLHE